MSRDSGAQVTGGLLVGLPGTFSGIHRTCQPGMRRKGCRSSLEGSNPRERERSPAPAGPSAAACDTEDTETAGHSLRRAHPAWQSGSKGREESSGSHETGPVGRPVLVPALCV